jgi:hypothetical protein
MDSPQLGGDGVVQVLPFLVFELEVSGFRGFVVAGDGRTADRFAGILAPQLDLLPGRDFPELLEQVPAIGKLDHACRVQRIGGHRFSRVVFLPDTGGAQQQSRMMVVRDM